MALTPTNVDDLELVRYLDHVVDMAKPGHCILVLRSGVLWPRPMSSPFDYPDPLRLTSAGMLRNTLAITSRSDERHQGQRRWELARRILDHQIAVSFKAEST